MWKSHVHLLPFLGWQYSVQCIAPYHDISWMKHTEALSQSWFPIVHQLLCILSDGFVRSGNIIATEFLTLEQWYTSIKNKHRMFKATQWFTNFYRYSNAYQ